MFGSGVRTVLCHKKTLLEMAQELRMFFEGGVVIQTPRVVHCPAVWFPIAGAAVSVFAWSLISIKISHKFKLQAYE
jgi:hypothetical protein